MTSAETRALIRRQRWEVAKERALRALALLAKFDPDQPRDESGRWTSGGGGAASKPSAPAAKPAKMEVNRTRTSAAFNKMIAGEMAKIPAPVMAKLAAFGAKVETAEFLTDARPDLKGQRPWGWPEGTTWDNVDGLYSRDNKTAVIAEFKKNGERDSTQSGTLLHEVGHAYDKAAVGGGYPMSHRVEFGKAYAQDTMDLYAEAGESPVYPERVMNRLSYFLQPGKAGKEEAFAEIFGWELGGEGTALMDPRPYFPRTTEVVRRAIQGQKKGRKFYVASCYELMLIERFKDWREQPRVPAGVPEGGQFGEAGSGGGIAGKPAVKPSRAKPSKPSRATAGGMQIDNKGGASARFQQRVAGQIQKLPAKVRSKLAAAGVKFETGKVLSDVRPGRVNSVTGSYYPQERTIVLAERAETGVTKINAQKGVVEHEVGHAFDAALAPSGYDFLSETDTFDKIYERDIERLYKLYDQIGQRDKNLENHLRGMLGYYTVSDFQPGSSAAVEAFGEIAGREMGGEGSSALDIRQYFPATTKYIRHAVRTGKAPPPESVHLL